MKGISLKYLTREGFRNVWVNRLMSLASVTVLLACLIIIGSGAMIYFNINEMLDTVENQNVVMVYIQNDATEAEVAEVGNLISQNENVSESTFVPKEVGLQTAIDRMDADASLFEGFSENPMPDAYRVVLKDLTQFEGTVNALGSLPKIESVRGNSDLADKLVKVRQAVTSIAIGLVVILFLVSLFIIANTIRITMFSRRLEISIMKAVGATNWFIRWPFMIEGVLLGVISATVSFFVLWGMYELIATKFTGLISLLSFSLVPFTSYAGYIALAFYGIGIFTGSFGSLFSMGKYLKEQGSVVSGE